MRPVHTHPGELTHYTEAFILSPRIAHRKCRLKVDCGHLSASAPAALMTALALRMRRASARSRKTNSDEPQRTAANALLLPATGRTKNDV